MSNIPNAEQSPRIVNGVIRWYQGDTFELELHLDIEDQDGAKKAISPSDKVDIVFRNKRDEVVKEFEFTEIVNNTVTLDVDAECTALFERGQYTYDVYYTGEERTTIANDNKAVVE